MAYRNQEKCLKCSISIPQVSEDADPDAHLCDSCYLDSAFKDFAEDHLEHFGAIPLEFEFEGRVYDADWCWTKGKEIGLNTIVK